ncbi:efflux RND transporter periplasmic adaptor subunit [Alginatibacterium sediminis]|uniref:Efflux RND transporter periplasmic adaptor subunit n=1 Tax=Alginatibacterium sediminis TaxID=2164068 RepID=A0A420EBI4_9ALTE|nr:efflux RND transporter periplasmic adaptor subunit [Alginatibacterium sediminis]RKF18031.1 efflux RND transporter periplasmic adaptor subunit [Alginatibacterium sediminis]
MQIRSMLTRAFPILVLFLAACDNNSQSSSQAPTVLVKTQVVQQTQYSPSQEFIGRIEAYEDAAISSQVTGYLLEQAFTDGEIVEQGQLLYKIDPAVYEAQVAQAKASVSQARAAVINAELNWERGKSLLPNNSISRAEFDGLTAQRASAQAQQEAAQALLKNALVSLGHTEIRAPFTGRMGRSLVSDGDLIRAGSGQLSDLVSLDPIRASFRMSENERLEFGLDNRNDYAKKTGEMASVELSLNNQKTYAKRGVLDYIGNRIELATGTIELSANFSNPNEQLLPGQFVKVRVNANQSESALVIPRRAVQSDLEGEFVLTVDQDNISTRKNVVLGSVIEQGVIIQSGLNGDEQIITSGLQRARAGTPVTVINDQAEG